MNSPLIFQMILSVKAKPKSGRSEVIEVVKDKEYTIYLKAEAENNKANIEIINLLSKYFNTTYDNVKVKRRKTSRNKVVEILK
ncbi:DUF167 domain-containing protein [Candidatus Pacearchaeota archaeon]|nr:DUF167 domain-containing protein [Candidatus Pacearchaeota archaeon]